MSEKQKTLRIISIIELIAGIAYIIEGLIVTSEKVSYFIAGALTLVTAVMCLLSVTDSSKAKFATILLWVTIALNTVGVILMFTSKISAGSIALAALDVSIAAYLIQLVREIHR